ncbi:MAG: thiazole synthase [Deltaproteobacteria bacterium]|nr:thiazole synthase [Deltaproteobacteria bacterium]HCH63632.1 thiazole synthase [Deltaproteobacteria bacterium]
MPHTEAPPLTPGARTRVSTAISPGEAVLTFGDLTIQSRLFVGTGKYPSYSVMQQCHEASGTELVTVALRRVDLNAEPGAGVLDHIDRTRIHLLPNTAGCYTPEDAVTTARLGRELLGTPLVKLEVIGDPRTLWPDAEGTLEAARVLVAEGFVVLPYCPDDPVVCMRLEEIGCAAVMPLAAPIGSGLGVRDPAVLRMIREAVTVPVVVDAGLGTASDAAIAMELGADAVLVNTAIAGAGDPIKMARAFQLAVEAGQLARESGRMQARLYASASSPESGLIGT